MAFSMESLTPQAYEDIHRQHSALIHRHCVPQNQWDPLWTIKQRAVDPDRRMTLMLVDKFAPNDQFKRYLVELGAHAFVFEMNGDDVEPFTLPPECGAQLADVRQAITEAFQVHGISGLRTPRAYEIPTPSFK
jgi:hypothetical protein